MILLTHRICHFTVLEWCNNGKENCILVGETHSYDFGVLFFMFLLTLDMTHGP